MKYAADLTTPLYLPMKYARALRNGFAIKKKYSFAAINDLEQIGDYMAILFGVIVENDQES